MSNIQQIVCLRRLRTTAPYFLCCMTVNNLDETLQVRIEINELDTTRLVAITNS